MDKPETIADHCHDLNQCPVDCTVKPSADSDHCDFDIQCPVNCTVCEFLSSDDGREFERTINLQAKQLQRGKQTEDEPKEDNADDVTTKRKTKESKTTDKDKIKKSKKDK